MAYHLKYLKYKQKYIKLKEQLGGNIIIDCDDNIFFHNRIDTCWNISLQMIFLFGDKTKEISQNTLDTNTIMDLPDDLIKALPLYFFNNNNYNDGIKDEKRDQIIYYFNELKKRIVNKTIEPSILKRQISTICEMSITQKFNRLF